MRHQTSEMHSQICTVSTVNLERSDLNQFLFLSIPKVAFVVFFIRPHGGSGMTTGRAHGFKEQGNVFWMLTHQETQSGIF